MPSWRNRLRRPFVCVLAGVSVIYPLLVYFGQSRVSPLTFVAIILALVGLRLATADGGAAAAWRFPFALAAAGIVVLAFLDLDLAVRSYPVLVNLGVGILFGLSLFRPPSLVERIARLREPDLPPEAVVYCRRVTLIWAAFGLTNGAVTWAISVWGTLAQWTLWTGVISYVLVGMLFAGELTVRTFVRRKRP